MSLVLATFEKEVTWALLFGFGSSWTHWPKENIMTTVSGKKNRNVELTIITNDPKFDSLVVMPFLTLDFQLDLSN